MSEKGTLVHLMAGGVGGTCGAVVTCPLEVVKTRLQSSGFITTSMGDLQPSIWSCLRQILVQEGPRGMFRGLVPNLVGVAPSRAIYFWSYSGTKAKINNMVPKSTKDSPSVHMISAGVAGLVSSCSTNPIWVVKTRLQLENERVHTSPSTIVRMILKQDGMWGFWRGLTASMYGITETVIHFVIYEALRKKYIEYRGRPPDSQQTMLDFLGFMGCGAVSKTIATSIAYPHEVVRTRLREPGSKYRSFWQTMGLVYREEGRSGLYRGLLTNLLRQIPNTAVMMATYELTVHLVTKYQV